MLRIIKAGNFLDSVKIILNSISYLYKILIRKQRLLYYLWKQLYIIKCVTRIEMLRLLIRSSDHLCRKNHIRKNIWHLFSWLSWGLQEWFFWEPFCWCFHFLLRRKWSHHFMRHFYSHFGGMCYRSCGKGHWKLLVPGRPDDHSCTHTNRWAWSSDCGCVCFPSFRKENILMQRSTMQDAISAPKVGGIVRLTRFILRNIFDRSCRDSVAAAGFYGRLWKKGIWMSVFHSISAFVMPALIFWGQIQYVSIAD